jgi:hypothetical protein
VVIAVMVAVLLAQGFYFWAGTLTFWPGPGVSPTLEQGLLIGRLTSIALIVAAFVAGLVARAYALGATVGACALLVLINPGLWPVVGVPGLIATAVLGVLWLKRASTGGDATRPAEKPV